MASETTLFISDGKLNYKTNKQGWTRPSGHLSGCVEIDELLFNAQSLLQNHCRNTVGSVGRMSRLSEAECGLSLHTMSLQCIRAAESRQNPGVTEQGGLPGSFNTWLSAQTEFSVLRRATVHREKLPEVPSFFAGIKSVWMRMKAITKWSWDNKELQTLLYPSSLDRVQ